MHEPIGKPRRRPTGSAEFDQGSQPAAEIPRLGAAGVLALQRRAGNIAVIELLRPERRPQLQRQQPAGGPTPGNVASDTADFAGPQTPAQLQELDMIQQRYQDMIAASRARGANVAADNLAWFLAGTGGVRQLEVAWLRSFGVVRGAEETNEGRFEDSLNDIANEMKDGETRTLSDNWDSLLTAWQTTELYYASGTSHIHSTGTFELRRVGKFVTISGTVEHRWVDAWDWHQGMVANVPGFGAISDNDGLLMQHHRGARPFDMEATWSRNLSGGIDLGLLLNSRYLYWRGPE